MGKAVEDTHIDSKARDGRAKRQIGNKGRIGKGQRAGNAGGASAAGPAASGASGASNWRGNALSVGCAVLGMGLLAGVFWLAQGPAQQDGAGTRQAGAPRELPEWHAAAKQRSQVAGAPGPTHSVIKDKLQSGETLGRAFQRHGIPQTFLPEVEKGLQPLFDFRTARPGDRWSLSRDDGGALIEFRFYRSPVDSYALVRGPEGLLAKRRTQPVAVQRTLLRGTVRKNLYDSIVSGGGEDLARQDLQKIASKFAEIFSWDVDFSRDVRPGDQYRALFERRYLSEGGEKRYLGVGRILASHYSNRRADYTAIYFRPGEQRRGGYYRANGASVRRQFLRAPLSYRRISSHFSYSRLHPIRRIRLPHPAIDYAAPLKTQVWSVASGKITYVGWMGALGKTVKVRHANGYISYYGHLHSFHAGISVGDLVRQKQVIGYVGSTGMSTAPHLDFRVKHRGKWVNPARLLTPPVEEIPEEHLPRFREHRDEYLSELGIDPLSVAMQEAL